MKNPLKLLLLFFSFFGKEMQKKYSNLLSFEEEEIIIIIILFFWKCRRNIRMADFVHGGQMEKREGKRKMNKFFQD